MTRTEYIHFTQTGKSKGKKPLITGKSVTDPTFARTGRQMIFQPLNIEYRMKYPDGVKLDKEHPHDIKEYDKIYPDIFDAIRQANADIHDTKHKLNKYKQQQQTQQTQQTQTQQTQTQQ